MGRIASGAESHGRTPTAGSWRPRLALVLILAAFILGTGLSAVLLSANRAVTRGQVLVAQFVGCKADDVTAGSRVAFGTEAGETMVRQSFEVRVRNASDVERVSVAVDTARQLVVMARWSFRTAREGTPRKRISAAEAEMVARAFLQRKCPYYDAKDQLTVREKAWDERAPAYSFEFRGPGPGSNSHCVWTDIDALRGAVSSYVLALIPPEPPASSPVKITEEKARRLALAKAEAKGITLGELTVRQLTTLSSFGVPGTPVWLVRVEGTRVLPGDRHEMCYHEQWAVHATTGEVLTVPTYLPSGPKPLPRE